MGTQFLRSLIAGLSLTLSLSTITFASDYVHRVIIVNEGYNDFNTGQQLVPVSVAYYDPSAKVYTVFDTIENQRFASDVLIDGDFIYVAADRMLVKYDKNTLQRVATKNIDGIRNLAVWNDKLIVTRGEYLVMYSSYFQVYNQSDLSLDYEIDTFNGPKYSTQDIEVIGDNAYFLINNGFDFPNYKGLVGVVDMSSQSYVDELDLGSDGLNPDNLMRDGDFLYTLNNKDFTGSSVSIINLNNTSLSTANLPNVSAGCGTSTFFTGSVWYQQYGTNKLHVFDPISQLVIDSVEFNKNFYGIEVDPVNNLFYATTTDFVSSGMAFVYDASYTLVDSFTVGVSAGNIAFDVRKTTGIFGIENDASFSIYPNPAITNLNIETHNVIAENLKVLDISGRTMMDILVEGKDKISLDLYSLSQGVYHIVLTDFRGNKTVNKLVRL